METNNGNKELSKQGTNNRMTRRQYKECERLDVVNQIIDEYIEDNKTLTKVLSKNTAFPSLTTFFNWCANDPKLKSIYTHAREAKAHAMIDEALRVAKGSGEDTVCKVQRDRLYSDRLIYAAGKYLPNVYGDKVDVTSGGEAVNMVLLGVGIAPPSEPVTIDITPEKDRIGSKQGND
jgi:hypothetical protein